jgi:O-acetyl-ADP-ribose deacetylase (regulator of RNase III)
LEFCQISGTLETEGYADMDNMKIQVKGSVLELVEGDITQQDTEAIVNAANSSLLGGGGVDGAIHRVGGPAILAECHKLGGCATGDAKITKGGRLRAHYVIHAVGPIYWQAGPRRAAELLASAYRRSLEVAVESSVQSVAFPSLSTGAYGYPIEEAALIALQTAIDFLAHQKEPGVQLVRFVLYGRRAYEVYQQTLSQLVTGSEPDDSPGSESQSSRKQTANSP